MGIFTNKKTSKKYYHDEAELRHESFLSSVLVWIGVLFTLLLLFIGLSKASHLLVKSVDVVLVNGEIVEFVDWHKS